MSSLVHNGIKLEIQQKIDGKISKYSEIQQHTSK